MASTNGESPTLTRDQLSRFEDMVGNVLMSRAQLLSKFLDPRRSIEDECGYPSVGWIDPKTYDQLYDREAIAARVVEVMPKEAWQVQPTVYEKEKATIQTEFEKAWLSLGKQLSVDESFYEDESGSIVWDYLRRMDIISGIGQYGILLLGVDDGRDPREPVSPNKGRRLLFARCFPESLAPIIQFEADRNNPRYGQPVMYQVTVNDPTKGQNTGIGLTTMTVDVHWSRVIHVADNLQSPSEVFGIPRMRPVLNRILDLRKLYAGCAEMYWRGAFPGLSFETDPALGGELKMGTVETDRMRDTIENYMNGLQRYLALNGFVAKSLAPQVVDPKSQIACMIEAICIDLGVPKRVFMGSERGELASTQDDAAWNDRLRERQRNYLTPRLIVPFVNRLIAIGILPKPSSFRVVWPDLTSQSEDEKAAVAVKRTQALVQYIAGGGESVIAPMDYLSRIMAIDEKEAVSILEGAEEHLKKGGKGVEFRENLRSKGKSLGVSGGPGIGGSKPSGTTDVAAQTGGVSDSGRGTRKGEQK